MSSFFAQCKSVDVGGCNMNYYRSGSGETLILVHGITTYSFIWANLVEQLSQKFDVIAIDLIGCGESDMPLNVPYSLKQHAQFLKHFVDALHISKFHFIGHDLGGGIGQIFATSYVEQLHDLTIINGVAFDFWPVQPIIAMRTPIIRQIAMATVSLGAFSLIVKRGMYHKERCTKEVMDNFYKPISSALGKKAFLHFAESLDNRDLLSITDALEKLTIPVLILRGDGDVYLSGKIAEALERTIPNSTLKRISTAGHFIQLDEPEWIVEQLFNFIQS